MAVSDLPHDKVFFCPIVDDFVHFKALKVCRA
jgi:hypothetical protein